MRIQAEQANIYTASVEIKSLTVSGKQVTLAVFRQLDSRKLIKFDDPILIGIPWGRINYHPDDCKTDSPHIYVVWQLDSDLYRDSIYKRPLDNIPYTLDLWEIAENHKKHVKLIWVKSRAFNVWRDEKNVLWAEGQYNMLPPTEDQWRGIKEKSEDINSCSCQSEINSLKIRQAQWHKNYNSIYEELGNLTHLFIAV